jgi:RNA recognition motif-containing protein
MNHLTLNYERGGPYNSFIANVPFIHKDAEKPPVNNDVYVGQIPSDVDHRHLKSFFSQFGEIERIFEGRRGPSRGMKWAFISFIHPEDAYKYALRFHPTNFRKSFATGRENCPRGLNAVPFSLKERYLTFLVISALARGVLQLNASANGLNHHIGRSIEAVPIHLRQ